MNIFELLTLILFLSASYFLGKVIGSYYGVAGWIIGVLFGLFFGMLVFLGLRKLMPFHWMPVCRQGKCGDNDYQHIENTDKGSLFVCACGGKYLLSGNYFMEVLDDGTIRPYMIRRKPGMAWEPESNSKR